MDNWFPIVLPAILVLARVSGFVLSIPIFGWNIVPSTLRGGLILVLTWFYLSTCPAIDIRGISGNWLAGTIAIFQEVLIGLGLGLVIHMLFMAVQLCGHIAAQQMGLADAGIIDPATGEEVETLYVFMQMTFIACLLIGGGHHIFLWILNHSYEMFPVGGGVNIAMLTEGLTIAGSAMLVFALKLAAPAFAAFLILTLTLAVIARVLPEMNILFDSFGMRIALGLMMAMVLLKPLQAYVAEMSDWLTNFLLV